MAFERYHYAAKDGFIDVLKECSKKEANTRDENGMTPVLWAAFEGRLEALRLLVGKGGDPDRADGFGNTALHLCAARGHFSCVDFLVKFGCNLFSMDIDNHSAKDLAAINNRDEILRYLDTATVQLETSDKKKAKSMKEAAKKAAEKRLKEFSKKHKGGEPLKMINQNRNVLQTWKQKLWAGSQGNIKTINDIAEASKRYSSLVGGSVSSKNDIQKKLSNGKSNDDFKIGEIEANGQRSVRSIQGLRRDSEVLYVGTYETVEMRLNGRGKINDVFKHTSSSEDFEENTTPPPRLSNLSRSISQPDFLVNASLNGSQNGDEEGSNSTGDNLPRRQGNFGNRNIVSTLAIPRATAVEHSDRSSSTESSSTNYRNNQSLIKTKPRQFPVLSETDSEDEESNVDQDGRSSIERFLIAWGLGDFVKLFEDQQIDLDTLMLLTETDLRSLNLPLGPFRKLCVAIQERKSAFQHPGIITDIRF